MANWRSVFAVAAFLPVLASAADPAMLELIMPDARVVMEINLDRIAASPIGQSMSAQMKAELASFRPTMQDPEAGLGALGVPILSSGKGNPVVAFLDGSIAIIGQPAEVKAAIGRRGQNTAVSPVL